MDIGACTIFICMHAPGHGVLCYSASAMKPAKLVLRRLRGRDQMMSPFQTSKPNWSSVHPTDMVEYILFIFLFYLKVALYIN